MQFAHIDDKNVYLGSIPAVAAVPPDVGYYAPSGIRVSLLGLPPTDNPGKWRDTGTEWVEITIDEARAEKLAEILAAANAVKAALSSRYSALEESTWPEQEAGARAILGDAENVKDKTARLILLDAAGRDAAVALVDSLAAADGAARETFAARITANADAAHAAGITALLEQRAMEAAVRNAKNVEEVWRIEVGFNVVG